MIFVREYTKNQQHKRDLATLRQERELRWKEEDHAVRLAESARNSAGLKDHAESMRRLAGLSYVTLRCHEDTWTFIARVAFGQSGAGVDTERVELLPSRPGRDSAAPVHHRPQPP